MTKHAKHANSLFIPSSFGGNIAAPNDFYARSNHVEQLVFRTFRNRVTNESLNSLGRQLASLLRTEYAARRFDNVEQIQHLMVALPLPREITAVADHYRGYSLARAGMFDAAEELLCRAADNAAQEYKARTFYGLGLAHYYKGEVDGAVHFFLLAARLGLKYDPITFIQSQQILAEIYGLNGDITRAIERLEAIFPAVITASRTYPVLRYEFLNNLAVDLGDVGRVDEAQAALNIALNSPYAAVFPEWGRTRDELETKRRHPRPSFVSLSSVKPVEPTPQRKKRRLPKPARRNVTTIVRALAIAVIAGLPFKNRGAVHWLAGLSIFRSASLARILIKPIGADLEALLPVTSDWPTSGPGPRAPPSIR